MLPEVENVFIPQGSDGSDFCARSKDQHRDHEKVDSMSDDVMVTKFDILKVDSIEKVRKRFAHAH